MFIVFYSCVWSSRVLDFFFLLHLWNEELVRMIVGECKSSRQRNICHRGITALWSHSQLEESVLDGRICKGVWSFQWRCWLQGYTCKHSLIHPLIPDVVFAAKHRFIILIRISMHLPKMTESWISDISNSHQHCGLSKNCGCPRVKDGFCDAFKTEVMFTSQGVCRKIFIFTKYNNFTACLLIFKFPCD